MIHHSTPRMQAIQSPIIPIVGELIRNNPGTISLGQGVVHYGPPPDAIASFTQFLAEPSNHQYKAVRGIPELLAAIETKLLVDNQVKVDETTPIVVTAGSNMAFMNAILAIASPGDEIILSAPYYFNHDMAIGLASCHPVIVPTDRNYQLDLEAIERAITPKTRAVVTISPNNPTGAVYSEMSLRAINQLCGDRGIYHISDEAYEYFTYNGIGHISPGSFAGSQGHTISLYSLSKTYGFASWRIGYMVVPQHLLDSILKIQDTILICPPVVCQYAAVASLQVGRSYCQPYIEAIAETRTIVLNALQELTDFCTIAPADGAFYVFLKVDTDLDALVLVRHLIEQHRVAVIPGTTFGMDRGCYLRVAYGSLSQQTAEAGIDRLVKGLKQILKTGNRSSIG
jgi:aspartate/methionine/tyrosine aminotransferase